MTAGERNFGGPGRIALLEHIGTWGSITRAAKAAQLSYKAAWDAIDTMNTLAGEPLVQRLTGGKGGGGTRLTPRGLQLVVNYRRLEAEHRRFVEHLSRQASGLADDYLLLRSMTMKTSARNQFLGRVVRIEPGAVNDLIELDIGAPQPLVALLTRESTQSLGLQIGTEAFALIKASSIILLCADDDDAAYKVNATTAATPSRARFSARNCLSGTIMRITPGAVNAEVVLQLSGSASLAAIITQQSCTDMQLAVGQRASALFKASSVIVGVSG
jgi:molybdate transport system regulatory protein